MALEHMCVSIGDPSTFTLIHKATCARTHLHARIGGAAAGAQRPRMRRRPTERGPPRCARGPKAALTEDNVVTRAVFHAPMFALNADAKKNVCEP